MSCDESSLLSTPAGSSILGSPSSTTPSTPRRKMSKFECFQTLSVENDDAAQEHLSAALLNIMSTNGIENFVAKYSRNKFFDAIREDVNSPGTPKLGARVQAAYHVDPEECMKALYRLASYYRIRVRDEASKPVLDPTVNSPPSLFVNSNPPYRFNQQKRTMIIDTTLRVFLATSNPPAAPMVWPLHNFLLDFRGCVITEHQGPWIRRDDVYLAPFMATIQIHFHKRFDPMACELVSTSSDPSEITKFCDFWATKNEACVNSMTWLCILETALQGKYGRIPQPPFVPTPLPVLDFILRPKLQIDEILAQRGLLDGFNMAPAVEPYAVAQAEPQTKLQTEPASAKSRSPF